MFGVEPLLDLIEDWPGLLLAQLAALHGVEFFGLALDPVKLLYPGEQGVAAQRVAGAGVVEVAPAVCPARGLDHNSVSVIVIVGGVDAVVAAECIGL